MISSPFSTMPGIGSLKVVTGMEPKDAMVSAEEEIR
jgi:hypothetical protein